MNLNQTHARAASSAIKRSCLMQSKALDRSLSSAPPKAPLYKASFHFSTIPSRQCYYYSLGKNPIDI